MECRPPCRRPGGWTGRCWPDTPCTGWSLSRCSVPLGRARRMSQTARSPAHRPGKKRRPHPLHWSPWWSRSLPCHWWTVCSGTRAKETTMVSSCHCIWTLTTALCAGAPIQGLTCTRLSFNMDGLSTATSQRLLYGDSHSPLTRSLWASMEGKSSGSECPRKSVL